MKNIIFSELIRYQKWALVLALLNFCVLYTVNAVASIATDNAAFSQLAPLVFLLISSGFAAVQIASHKKLSHWTYLIHRPLSPTRIYAGLVMAALLLAAIALFLPLLLILTGNDLLTDQLIEGRHYLMLPYLLGLCLSGYFAVSFALLHGSRLAWLVTLLPLYYSFGVSGSLAQFAVQYAIVVWLALLCIIAFKPNLGEAPKSQAALLITALPVQLALFLVLGWVVFNAHQISTRVTGSHPFDTPAEDGYYQAMRNLDQEQRIRWALAGSDAEDARRQLTLSEITAVKRPHQRLMQFQQPQQMAMADRGQGFTDKDNQLHWRFSHRQMRYRGIRTGTGETVAWLGTKGTIDATALADAGNRFETVPQLLNDRYLVTPHRVYLYDSQVQRLYTKFIGTEDESIRLITPGGNFVGLLTDRRLYLLDNNPTLRDNSQLTPFARLPLPRRLGALSELLVAELVDGYLVSMIVSDRYPHGGHHNSEIFVSKVGFDGETELLGHRRYVDEISPLVRYSKLLMSPLYLWLDERLEHLTSPLPWHLRDQVSLTRMPPAPHIALVAVGIMLLCVATVLILAWRSKLSPMQRLGWGLLTLMAGLPALISFYCLAGWRDKTASLVPQPARDGATS